MTSFVCTSCRDGIHYLCRKGNWCDCQCHVPDLWENLSARLTVLGNQSDVEYEVTVGVARLQEYANQAPVTVPIVPGL